MCSRRPLRQVRRLFSRLLISVLCFQCRIYDFLPLLVKIFLAHGTGLQGDAGENQRDDDDGRGNDRVLYGKILKQCDRHNGCAESAENAAGIEQPHRNLDGALGKLFRISLRDRHAGDIQIAVDQHRRNHQHADRIADAHARQDRNQRYDIGEQEAEIGVSVTAFLAESGGKPSIIRHVRERLADHRKNRQERGDDGADAAADDKEGEQSVGHDGLCGNTQVFARDLIVRENPGGDIRHQAVNDRYNDAGHQNPHRDRALGILCDRHHSDRSHGGSLTGPSHDGDGADHAAEASVEEASVKGRIEEIRRVHTGNTHDDKQDEGNDQKAGRHILKERYNSVTPDRKQEEQREDNRADQRTVFIDDREQIAKIAGKRKRIAGKTERPDNICPPAVSGEQGRKQHALHAVIAAVYDEDTGHAEVVPVREQHVKDADDGDRKNGTPCSLDRRAKCDKDTGADSAANAQADNIPQPDLFDVFVIHCFLRFVCFD